MQRYMISDSLLGFSTKNIRLENDFYHHMKNVMRFKPGIKLYITDPEGISCIAEIKGYTENAVELAWVADEEQDRELPVQITIASGLSKGDKLDWIIQKSTELGAGRIIPFDSQYTIVKWDAAKKKKKQQRFQRIATEAAEQSHRQNIPEITDTMDLQQLITFAEHISYKLVAYEEEAKSGEEGIFAQTLSRMKPGDHLLIVFGPEGGLHPDEVAAFRESGFLCCGLGPRIMRTETAPLYALAAVSYHFELMNGGD